LLGGPKPFPDVAAFRDALRGTSDLPTHVTQAMRAAQIGLQALLLLPGLLIMFGLSGLFGAISATKQIDAIRSHERPLPALSAPLSREQLSVAPQIAPLLAHPHFAIAAATQLERDRERWTTNHSNLSSLERLVVRQSEGRGDPKPVDAGDPELIAAAQRAVG